MISTLNFLRSKATRMLILATALTQLPAQAESRFEEDFADTEKPWQEIAVQLPKLSDKMVLLPFDVSATATQSFAVAPDSLTLGDDGVIRYVLVAVSASGAKSVSYEGLRCATLEKKLYAFGRPDGSWSRSRRVQWEPISGSAANRQHAALAQDVFCDGKTVAGKTADMIARLKSGKSLNDHRLQ
jgi:hypothetical protein